MTTHFLVESRVLFCINLFTVVVNALASVFVLSDECTQMQLEKQLPTDILCCVYVSNAFQVWEAMQRLHHALKKCSPILQLLQSHGSADRMVLLLSVYQEEDEAYHDLVTVATTFFQYLLQPFRDMRELACLYKMEILVNTATYTVSFGL